MVGVGAEYRLAGAGRVLQACGSWGGKASSGLAGLKGHLEVGLRGEGGREPFLFLNAE